ncbi:MAG: DUF1553 domain-containing protein, partial [Planctomycetia bacterium]|nr:DUF1553 domain-containing protein [Planctomycetia bacterium]
DAAVDVDLGQTVQFDRDAKFSISAWVRPDAIGALWCKMDDSTSFRGFDAMMYDGGRLAVHIVHSWNDNALKVISKPRVRLGQWNHVCVTYDGTSKAAGVKIYFDGKLVPQDVEVDALKGTIITPKPFRLGRRSTSLHLKGAMGDFNIYDRTLSADEVREMVDASISHAAKSPLAGGNAAPGLSDFFAANDPQGAALKAKLTKLRSDREQFNKDELSPSVMVMEELPTPRPTYLLKRGQYDAPDKSQELQPGVPPFLPPLPAGAPLNRLTLARWLIDPTNPLVARVEVNRLWQRFFGIGLVRTPDNFGMQGDPPSHPELLDWLATELVRTGWDVKAMQKLMVMSAAYRQSSATSAELEAKDPENRLLARGPRHRLSAESIRDNALAAGGLLSLKIGGPSVKPYQPNGLWEELAGGAGEGAYQRDSGENLHRRSLYTYRKRTVPHPTTSTFDAPSWEICTVKRSRTNTPLQALALLNDETYVEAARGLGRRMMVEAGGNEARSQIEDRIRYGFRLATGRAAQPREVARLAASYQRYLDTFRADSKSADALLSVGELKPDAKLDKAEQAAYATVAAILLNLDETITKE